MIHFRDFQKFDRVKTLDPREQQRQYWIFRNDYLNPLFSRGGSGGGSGARRRREKLPKPPTIIPSSISFLTTPGEQFLTVGTDIIVRSSTGYVKALYPYEYAAGVFGTGDPMANISVVFTDLTPWNGALPFQIYSCDIDGNQNGVISYLKIDNLNFIKSLDLTPSKDDLIEVDVAGCVDLESITIPDSVSLINLNISNTQVQQLDINLCTYLAVLDITDTSFSPVYILDLSGLSELTSLIADGCNLFGLITNSPFLEEVSINDSPSLSSLILNQFDGNGGLGRIQLKNASLGPGGLDNLFNSLSTPNGTNNTIYIYNNPGELACDQTIATNKGYIVDTNP
jgi:hypothetical protein